MVPLVYAAAQTVLISLWLCDWKFWKQDRDGKILSASELSSRAIQLHVADFAWYTAFLLAIFGSIFSAIGGTSEFLSRTMRLREADGLQFSN
jgi:hypothetical protein